MKKETDVFRQKIKVPVRKPIIVTVVFAKKTSKRAFWESFCQSNPVWHKIFTFADQKDK